MKLALLFAGVVLMACSSESTSPTLGGPSASSSGPGAEDPKTSPDTAGPSQGEWHLKTIRGLVLGLERSTTGDSSAATTPPIANATVEIHKVSLALTAATGGDTNTVKLQDLGVVATRTTDNAGRFEYVIDEPLIVKTGQPSPLITYRLTITPPAGSPFAAQSGVQVFFAEQLPGDGVSRYYLRAR